MPKMPTKGAAAQFGRMRAIENAFMAKSVTPVGGAGFKRDVV